MEAAVSIPFCADDAERLLAAAERLLADESMALPTAAVLEALVRLHRERSLDRHQLRLVYPPEQGPLG